MSEHAPDVLLSGIRFAYPGKVMDVLDIAALTITSGEHVGLIGASGAGKTTLLTLIDGRLTGWSGRAEVLGRALSPSQRPPRQWEADVGFVFQDMALIDRLTVAENVRFGRLGRAHRLLSLVGRFDERDTQAVRRAIADVGLADLAYRRVDQLSGGQRQRVGVARCLAQEPRILIADEPVSNLDPASAEQVLGLLKSTAKGRDATLIISSHQPKLVAGFVDRIVGLKDGSIVFDRPTDKVERDDLVNLYGWHVAQQAA